MRAVLLLEHSTFYEHLVSTVTYHKESWVVTSVRKSDYGTNSEVFLFSTVTSTVHSGTQSRDSLSETEVSK